MMDRRKEDATEDIDAILERNKRTVAEFWAREYAREDSPWHRLAVGQAMLGLRD